MSIQEQPFPVGSAHHTGVKQVPNTRAVSRSRKIYRCVLELRVGPRLLDAGCASGFLPLLVAQRIPFLTEVVGVDIDTAAFEVASRLAVEKRLEQVRFAQADLLSEDVGKLGTFDTVVALHMLEHFSEARRCWAMVP